MVSTISEFKRWNETEKTIQIDDHRKEYIFIECKKKITKQKKSNNLSKKNTRTVSSKSWNV